MKHYTSEQVHTEDSWLELLQKSGISYHVIQNAIHKQRNSSVQYP